MDENSPKNNFGIDDFIAFAVVLLASCIIGIYFAYKDRKDSSMSTYFFGGKQMHPVAVGLSMAVTFQSSIAVIAEPTEAYIVGNVAIWYPITSFLAFTLSFFYFMPAFYRMDHGTIFEYLQIRFNTYVAKIAAITNTISTIFYMGLVVYAPATVLNAVTPISLNWSIVLTSVICTFYTALGGMKAVMWTDVFQSGIMIIGIISVFIQGLIKIGGFGSLFEALERGERYTAGRFDYGLISRISPLALLLGGVGQKLNSQGLSQQIVQRYQSCKSLRHAQYAALFYIVPTSLIFLINVGNGLVMYAYFEGCDPVKSGEIEEIDQGVPYMTLKLFADIPAMSGIFVAAVFSGSLSTISSGINSFSMVIVEDFISPCTEKVANSDTMKIILGKIFVVVLGIMLMLVAFAASLSESNIVPLLFSFSALTNGPIIGTFILGFFFPWANSVGATVGFVISLLLGTFLFVGSRFLRIPYQFNIPPTSTDMCKITNASLTTTSYMSNYTVTPIATMSTPYDDGHSVLQDIYNINFNCFIFFVILTVILVGLVTSLIVGPNKPSQANPKLFIPFIDNSCFPERVRRFFRFGVPEISSAREKTNPSFEEDKL